jgi:hypothetical protein
VTARAATLSDPVPEPAGEPRFRRLRATGAFLLRPWVLAFLGCFLLSAGWAFASPMSTSPDEPSHMVKAAATARGEFVNVTTRHEVKNGFEKTWLGYDLPAKYATLDAMSACFRLNSQSAACGMRFGTDETTTVVETSAGQNNPAYYWPVGLPSLVLPGVGALYGMRLMSALLNSALLAGAVAVAAQWRSPGWPMLGVLTCTTPMALFLNGTVNPNGMEASAAVLTWTVALSLALEPSADVVTHRLVLFAVGAVLLANSRSLGVLWLAAIVLAALFLGRRRAWLELARRRTLWAVAAVIAVGAVAAQLWNHYASTITPTPVSFPRLTPGFVATDVFWNSGKYIGEIVGDLGWLDTPLPPGALIAWYAVFGLGVLVALGCARWREWVVLGVLLVGTVVIPIVAQVLQAKYFGIGWQGRYILAWVFGVPVLAGMAVSRRVGAELPRPVEFRVPVVAVGVLALAGLAAFYWSMIRYAHGGFEKYLPGPFEWTPPGGWPLVWVVYAAGAAALVGVPRWRARVRIV